MIKALYIDHMGNDLTVVNSARISFNNESQEIEPKDIKLIDYLAKHKHLSPFEHNILTVLVECPLYIRSQIHRHRTFSYNEVSRRYTSEDISFYSPQEENIRKQSTNNKQASDGTIEGFEALKAHFMIEHIHRQSLDTYNTLIDMGVSREMARGILPQNLMTKFYMTGNLRNWIHFIKLRQDNHAQKEVQIIANDILNILEEKFPESVKALMQYD